MTAVLTPCWVAVTHTGSEPPLHQPGRPVSVLLKRVNVPSWLSHMLLPTMPCVSAQRPGERCAGRTGTVNVTQVGTENRGHSKRNTYGDGEQTGMVNETPVGTGNTSETAKIAQQQRVLKYYFILHCYISLNCCSHQRLYMPACITLLGGHFSSKAEALKIAILCSEAS